MKKFLCLIWFIFISLAMFAQSEMSIDTSKINMITPETSDNVKKFTKPITDFLYPTRIPIKNMQLNLSEEKTVSDWKKPAALSLPKMDLRLESYMSKITPNPLTVKTPYDYDFAHGGIAVLSASSYVTTSQNRQTLPLIGSYSSSGAQYTNKINDRLTISAGAKLEKYATDNLNYDLALNATAQYKITDNIIFTGNFQHSFDKNKGLNSNGMFGSFLQTSYGGNVNFMVTDKMNIRTGAYGASYSLYGLRKNDYGFNGEIGYWITDRIRVAAIGQYSANATRNAIGPVRQMGMYPQSYYGGYLEFKVNDAWGIRGGATREFDPWSRKWTTKPYFEIVTYK